MNYFKNILFFFLLAFNTIGQENLILNGDFEEYWECPDALTQVERCKYVYNPCIMEPLNTPCTADYFNRCSLQNSDCNVPLNVFGFQEPKSGNGYIGLVNGQPIGNYKEYIQLTFSEKLTPYSTYKFVIYTNLANYSGYATNLLHFKFTTEIVDYSVSLGNLLTPDIKLENLILEDTLGWIKIEFDYLAMGWEKFLIFGNFNQNSSQDPYYLYYVDPILGGGESYLYFDDASLRLIKKADPITFPNVFTPNDDGINDEFNILSGQEHFDQLTVINRWGNLIYYSDSSAVWNGKDMNGNKVSEGVYFVSVLSKIEKEGKQEQYHGMVHLIR